MWCAWRIVVKFAKVFFGQLGMMALVTWNFRMIAAGNVPMVALSEAIWAFLNFWYLKFIVRDDSTSTYLGYALGCVAGTTGSVWLTIYLTRS
jgi:hypothetical protein